MSRAVPMAPEERREAIIAATLPLLLEHGPELSTREIARAAGVAEGTIFRVFDTKHDLIHATIGAALSPDAAIECLANLPEGQPLVERVTAILELLRNEIHRTRSLFLHLARGDGREGRRPWPPFPPHDKKNHPNFDNRARLSAAVSDALAAYSEHLAVPTDVATKVLSALSFASLTLLEDEPLSQSAALADVVLHGIAKGDS